MLTNSHDILINKKTKTARKQPRKNWGPKVSGNPSRQLSARPGRKAFPKTPLSTHSHHGRDRKAVRGSGRKRPKGGRKDFKASATRRSAHRAKKLVRPLRKKFHQSALCRWAKARRALYAGTRLPARGQPRILPALRRGAAWHARRRVLCVTANAPLLWAVRRARARALSFLRRRTVRLLSFQRKHYIFRFRRRCRATKKLVCRLRTLESACIRRLSHLVRQRGVKRLQLLHNAAKRLNSVKKLKGSKKHKATKFVRAVQGWKHTKTVERVEKYLRSLAVKRGVHKRTHVQVHSISAAIRSAAPASRGRKLLATRREALRNALYTVRAKRRTLRYRVLYQRLLQRSLKWWKPLLGGTRLKVVQRLRAYRRRAAKKVAARWNRRVKRGLTCRRLPRAQTRRLRTICLGRVNRRFRGLYKQQKVCTSTVLAKSHKACAQQLKPLPYRRKLQVLRRAMRRSNKRRLSVCDSVRTKEQKAFFLTLQRAISRSKTFKAKRKKTRLHTNARRGALLVIGALAAKQIQYKAFVAPQRAETNHNRGAILKNLRIGTGTGLVSTAKRRACLLRVITPRRRVRTRKSARAMCAEHRTRARQHEFTVLRAKVARQRTRSAHEAPRDMFSGPVVGAGHKLASTRKSARTGRRGAHFAAFWKLCSRVWSGFAPRRYKVRPNTRRVRRPSVLLLSKARLKLVLNASKRLHWEAKPAPVLRVPAAVPNVVTERPRQYYVTTVEPHSAKRRGALRRTFARRRRFLRKFKRDILPRFIRVARAICPTLQTSALKRHVGRKLKPKLAPRRLPLLVTGVSKVFQPRGALEFRDRLRQRLGLRSTTLKMIQNDQLAFALGLRPISRVYRRSARRQFKLTSETKYKREKRRFVMKTLWKLIPKRSATRHCGSALRVAIISRRMLRFACSTRRATRAGANALRFRALLYRAPSARHRARILARWYCPTQAVRLQAIRLTRFLRGESRDEEPTGPRAVWRQRYRNPRYRGRHSRRPEWLLAKDRARRGEPEPLQVLKKLLPPATPVGWSGLLRKVTEAGILYSLALRRRKLQQKGKASVLPAVQKRKKLAKVNSAKSPFTEEQRKKRADKKARDKKYREFAAVRAEAAQDPATIAKREKQAKRKVYRVQNQGRKAYEATLAAQIPAALQTASNKHNNNVNRNGGRKPVPVIGVSRNIGNEFYKQNIPWNLGEVLSQQKGNDKPTQPHTAGKSEQKSSKNQFDCTKRNDKKPVPHHSQVFCGDNTSQKKNGNGGARSTGSLRSKENNKVMLASSTPQHKQANKRLINNTQPKKHSSS